MKNTNTIKWQKKQYVQYPAEILKKVSMYASLLDTVSLTAAEELESSIIVT